MVGGEDSLPSAFLLPFKLFFEFFERNLKIKELFDPYFILILSFFAKKFQKNMGSRSRERKKDKKHKHKDSKRSKKDKKDKKKSKKKSSHRDRSRSRDRKKREDRHAD